MRTDMVVLTQPLPDDDLGFFQTVEDFSIQQLISELAIEGFTAPLLRRAARFDEARFGSDLCQSIAYDLGRHLWAVIGPDVFWDTTHQYDIRHCVDDTEAIDPARNTDRRYSRVNSSISVISRSLRPSCV